MNVPKITLYDTLLRSGSEYVVIGETEKDFIIKELCYQYTSLVGGGKRSLLSKADYYSGKSGYRRADFPRIKTYNIHDKNV